MVAERVEVVARFRGYEIENGREILQLDLEAADIDNTLDKVIARIARRHGKGEIGDYEIYVEPQYSRPFTHSG